MPLDLEIDRRVRHAVYQHFAEWARAPEARAIASRLGERTEAVEASWRRLDAEHLLVLAPDANRLWMAPPFSAIPTEFLVEARGRRYFANCAWDALSIPALIDADAMIDTTCGDRCGAIRFSIVGGRIEGSESAKKSVVHVAVPAKHFWDNIGFT